VSDEIDPYNIEEYSEKELSERLQELEEIPYMSQGESNEADLIEDRLYELAEEDRKSGSDERFIKV